MADTQERKTEEQKEGKEEEEEEEKGDGEERERERRENIRRKGEKSITERQDASSLENEAHRKRRKTCSAVGGEGRL
jgi:hypothetical protein